MVLGFDKLLHISLESKRAPTEKRKSLHAWGIGIAIVLGIVLLFLLDAFINKFEDPLFSLSFEGAVEGAFNPHAIIVLFGGAFIMYTATKEILHMMRLEHD
jgi:predicted tellurium resistance membrane protein TerC